MAPLALWTTVFGTLYQLALLLFGVLRFNKFISFIRGANNSGRYEFVKNALLLAMFSYAPLVSISITFMWVAYAKKWEAGMLFVVLPLFSILWFVLTLLATRNDISDQIDVMRRGRKRLPIQPPPQHIVAATGNFDPDFSPSRALPPQGRTPPRPRAGGATPRRAGSATPTLPLQH